MFSVGSAFRFIVAGFDFRWGLITKLVLISYTVFTDEPLQPQGDQNLWALINLQRNTCKDFLDKMIEDNTHWIIFINIVETL